MKKSWIIILGIAIIIIGIIAGVSIYEMNRKEIAKKNVIENEINEISEEIVDECTDEWNRLQEEARLEIEANANEEKISPNCKVILKRYYTECQHTINEYIDIPQSLVNGKKEDLEKEYSNWEVKEYSSTEIVLYREFESTCGQHFVLRNDNGKITVYRINENNEEVEYQKTEISIDYLTETDKVQIQNGIRVNGMEELNQLIEDFE